jgi:hypothetical protein
MGKSRRLSSSGSPVEEMPAAWVRVAKRMPRERIKARLRQSSAKPAEGGSKATGAPAIGVPHPRARAAPADAHTESACRGSPARPR